MTLKPIAALTAEDLDRFGWKVEVDEANNEVSVTCPKCHVGAFTKMGEVTAIDPKNGDVMHVFRHYVATDESKRALTLMHKIVMAVGSGEVPEAERYLLLRALAASLRGFAPDVVCDELESATRW